MTQNITLEITEQGVSILKKEGSSITHQSTTVSELIRAFSEESAVTTPLLPGLYGSQQYIRSGNREIYVMSEPAMKRKAFFNDYGDDDETEEFDIVTPPVIFFFVVEVTSSGRRELLHTVAHSMKGPLLSQQQDLYVLPFSNTNQRYVCWGTNPQLGDTGKSMSGLITQFFAAPFNSDLDSGKYNSFESDSAQGYSISSTHSLLKHLNHELDKDSSYTFPMNILRTAENNYEGVISDLVNEYLG